MNSKDISIVLPAKDEATSLQSLLPELKALLPEAQLIVVNDGSTDDTVQICIRNGAQVLSQPYSLGNGAAIKAGARIAKGSVLLFLDADGQHQPTDIPRLLEKLEQGYDMVVGARDSNSQAGLHRSFANRFYNRLASWVVGQPIADLTSGFRIVRADKFRKYLYLLPNGFSYPTTITICFFRAGYTVAYMPIRALKRNGKSHIRFIHDGIRFLLIIFKIGALYSPLKIFFPISLMFFVLGFSHYLYTFIMFDRFTNMSALLFIASMLIFLIGLVSEQITALNYRDSEQ